MKIILPAVAVIVIAGVNLSLPAVPAGSTARFTLIAVNLVLLALGCYYIYLGSVALRREAAVVHGQQARVKELEGALQTAEKRAGELAFGAEQQQRAADAEIARLKSGGDRASVVNAGVVHFLSLLQQKGRFIDFVMDDITPYDDKQVGAAARVVHQGCASVLKEYFDIVPVREGSEGVPVTVEREDTGGYRLVGKVVGKPPFKGTLLHRGWRTRRVSLPQLAATAAPSDIIQPAEVELT
jgi:hypothetical protein